MASLWLEAADCAEGDFPAVCLRCGGDAAPRRQTFYWIPAWVYLLAFLHPVIFIGFAAPLSRQKSARVPLCPAHRWHWLWRRVVVFGGLALLTVAIVAVVQFAKEFPGDGEMTILILGVGGLIEGWVAVALVTVLTGIRAKRVSKRGVCLAGVSEAFAAAYPGRNRARAEALSRLAPERCGERPEREARNYTRGERGVQDDA